MKKCSGKCGEVKALSEYHLKRGKPQAQCKKCRAEYMASHYQANVTVEKAKRKAWYEQNKSVVLEKAKANHEAHKETRNLQRRLKKFGITENQYNQKLQDNNNACEICKKAFTETPAIDHNHETLAFRSLLCGNCNTGFGLLKENVVFFQSCIEYALKYKK